MPVLDLRVGLLCLREVKHPSQEPVSTASRCQYVLGTRSTFLGRWCGRLIVSVCPAAKPDAAQRHNRNRTSHSDHRRIKVRAGEKSTVAAVGSKFRRGCTRDIPTKRARKSNDYSYLLYFTRLRFERETSANLGQ